MLYSSIVQRDETGLTQIYENAKAFDEENALEAIISCKFNLRKVQQVLSLVRIYQNRLNLESGELVVFSENFIEQYATDNNKCFEMALRLVRKIGTTITGSMKIFRKFCPVVRRKYEGREIVPVLDYTKLTRRLYVSDFYGSEPYEETVKTLLHEMSAFFHHLVATMALCKEMIQKEREVRGDYERLKEIFEKSCDEVLRSVNEVVGTFGRVQLVSPEELEERRRNARPMHEWLAPEYHAHDKQWMRREGYILRTLSGEEDGLDETASQLWPKDHAKAKQVLEVLDKLHTLGLGTKKSHKEGSKPTYDTLEMVYLLKWSGVSHTDEKGTVVNEVRERRLYKYMEQRIGDGSIQLPSWQGVCGSRRYCYGEKMTHEEMANAFAAHLPKEEQQEAKVAVLPFSDKKAAVDF